MNWKEDLIKRFVKDNEATIRPVWIVGTLAVVGVTAGLVGKLLNESNTIQVEMKKKVEQILSGHKDNAPVWKNVYSDWRNTYSDVIYKDTWLNSYSDTWNNWNNAYSDWRNTYNDGWAWNDFGFGGYSDYRDVTPGRPPIYRLL